MAKDDHAPSARGRWAECAGTCATGATGSRQGFPAPWIPWVFRESCNGEPPARTGRTSCWTARMRQRNLRRTLGLVVSLAGQSSVAVLGCEGAGQDASAGGDGAAIDLGLGDRSPSPDAADDGGPENHRCAPTFQCTGTCTCSGTWTIDKQFVVDLSPAVACDLMGQAWPNGGNVPFGAACQSACGVTTAMQCAVANATYYSEFQQANAGAGVDASAYVCPPAPDGSATIAFTCDSEHFDPLAGCQWSMCVTGRRPEGLQPAPRRHDEHPLALYFAECAHLEAASVLAFERMRAELATYRAPPTLQRSARRAARDEARHARLTRHLARRFGAGRATRPTVAWPQARSLAEMALENATEGLVRETFGAAMALWQARHASDAEVRGAMTEIAEDECRHAALSWRVARWLDGKLAEHERARVLRAARAAIEALREEISRAQDPDQRDVAGLPSAAEAAALLALLEQHVWASRRSPPENCADLRRHSARKRVRAGTSSRTRRR
jgi:hypothetical protein